MNLDLHDPSQRILFYVAAVVFIVSFIGFALTAVYFELRILKKRLSKANQGLYYGRGFCSWLTMVFCGLTIFTYTVVYPALPYFRYIGLFFLLLGLVSGWRRGFPLRGELELYEKKDELRKQHLGDKFQELQEKIAKRLPPK